MSENWNTVTKDNPCPICEKPDWCGVTEDGSAARCMRLESDRPSSGGWIHLIGDQPKPRREFVVRTQRKTDKEQHAQWAPIARHLWRNAGQAVTDLAKHLGVSRAALDALRVGYGYCDGPLCWSFPERNHNGLIVGITRRLPNPGGPTRKMCAKGSRRGLSYSDDWADHDGPVFVVEGGSDTAAGLTLGLAVVGRPSNVAMPYLVQLLGPHVGRRIVVLGENDRKGHESLAGVVREKHDPRCPGCQLCWPGKYGMEKVWATLRAKLSRPVEKRILSRAKDLREWLANQGLDVDDYAACCAAGRTLWK